MENFFLQENGFQKKCLHGAPNMPPWRHNLRDFCSSIKPFNTAGFIRHRNFSSSLNNDTFQLVIDNPSKLFPCHISTRGVTRVSTFFSVGHFDGSIWCIERQFSLTSFSFQKERFEHSFPHHYSNIAADVSETGIFLAQRNKSFPNLGPVLDKDMQPWLGCISSKSYRLHIGSTPSKTAVLIFWSK